MASESLQSPPPESDRGRTTSRHHHDPLAHKRETTPHAVRAGNMLTATPKWFPLGYREGFAQWWAGVSPAAAEHKVLSFLPYLQHEPPTQQQTGHEPDIPTDTRDGLASVDPSQPGEVTANSVGDPYGPRRWRSSMVQLSGKNRALNELSVERVGEDADQHLVMLHGYGAGLGFFYKNFEPLSRPKGWHVYALDMLGMGRSTRPPFRIKAKRREDAIKEAEDWFVDALEEWRVKRKIDRFTLLGHSLGGYMAVAYALKYPGRLNKLLLASPVGIPEDPYAVREDMPEPSASTMVNEFTQDQQRVFEDGDSQRSDATGSSPRAMSKLGNISSNSPPRRTLPKWFAYLWDANISPFTFVRWAGPFGPRLVSGWTSRRFSHLPEEEAKALHTYAYSIFRLRGSGEYALSYVLAPGAFARNPLIRRIHQVGRQMIQPVPEDSPSQSDASLGASPGPSPSPPPDFLNSSESSVAAAAGGIAAQPRREHGIPIVFLYGDHDWMDVAGGFAAKEKIDEERERTLRDATPEERQADRGSAKVVIIKRAGHHLYLDGWEEFNKVILEEMEDVRRQERERGRATPPS
ncbi:hypothetical protein MPDQ_003013 [Monascus purpureus]|uniref:AB hydrolase-1 domain-containing protein n=1 Tax=Monascus purpureus TaxID=5098 RepID=A0A507R8I8_MONPU|nr:hypothetical protein MPDQ_003013 [Monascus purpureus]BDD59420.1 hypothetical protein MAP00_004627 [Monascus purpureus]